MHLQCTWIKLQIVTKHERLGMYSLVMVIQHTIFLFPFLNKNLIFLKKKTACNKDIFPTSTDLFYTYRGHFFNVWSKYNCVACTTKPFSKVQWTRNKRQILSTVNKALHDWIQLTSHSSLLNDFQPYWPHSIPQPCSFCSLLVSGTCSLCLENSSLQFFHSICNFSITISIQKSPLMETLPKYLTSFLPHLKFSLRLPLSEIIVCYLFACVSSRPETLSFFLRATCFTESRHPVNVCWVDG